MKLQKNNDVQTSVIAVVNGIEFSKMIKQVLKRERTNIEKYTINSIRKI